jgi:O-antigen ligase
MGKPLYKSIDWTITDWCLAWILFFSVVQQRWSPVGFGLWMVVLLKNHQWRGWKVLIAELFSGISGLFILYFLWLSFGVVWSENTAIALAKLENKLSFILFPILIQLSKMRMTSQQWKSIFVFTMAFVLCLYEGMALVRYLDSPGKAMADCFSGSVFSPFMHRSYLACYLCLGLVFLADQKSILHKKWFAVLVVFFSIGVIQTLSKIGLIIWVCLLCLYLMQSMRRLSMRRLIGVLAVIFGFVVLVVISMGPYIFDRFNNVGQSIKEMQLYNNTSVESNAARLIMWNTSIELLQEHWLMGLGTGDADLALKVRNEELGNVGVASEGLNSHNQFLTTALQIGILGLGLLVWVFVQAWKRSKGNHLTALVVGVFFLNCLVESFLETQSGVVLFCVLMVLLFDLKDRKGQLSMD